MVVDGDEAVSLVDRRDAAGVAQERRPRRYRIAYAIATELCIGQVRGLHQIVCEPLLSPPRLC